jgi:hypothetical protein
MAAARSSEQSRRTSVVEIIGLALLAYLPFLLSPGELSSDSKQYLYLDPGRFLERVPYLWDRHIGAGTLSHQHIGYLFPMGPFFWLADAVGVSDALAQRLWLGSISLVAALGARWLFRGLGAGRAGAIAGALVYVLAPYQLAFTARMSVLLLPWAALPWLVGLVMRGVRERGWRCPAAIALIVMTAGSVNVSSLLLASVAPIVWLVARAAGRRHGGPRRVWSFSWRTAILVVAASLWWLNGLRLQGRYGLPVLQLTENVRTVSEFSRPNDVLRGLGNWFFYGQEPNGNHSLPQADGYASNDLVILASYAIPAGALLAGFLLRWRYRAYCVALLVVGTVIGVGSSPYSNSSVVGGWWRTIADRWSVATALRNTPRIGPIIVLACAALLAAAVRAVRGATFGTPRREWIAAGAVAVVAATAFLPVWQHGYFAEPFERPRELPAYWQELAESLDADGASTRVLEVPGSNFALFRWGNTIEPVTPGLIDRPYLAREVLPYGTEGTVNLLDAFDRRLQMGTFEPATLAPVARLFASGTIVVRNDLNTQRSGAPRPELVWASLTDPLAPGLEPAVMFGAGDVIPPVARFEVDSTNPIVGTAPVEQPIVIAGDGDGIVDSAAAGIVTGNSLVLELAALDDDQLASALEHDADLVLTDSNRRRYRNYFSSIAATSGPTEGVGELLDDPYGYAHRPNLFAHDSDDERSVVEQSGGTATASRDGGSGRPEDRAARAFDGDLRTSWRVDGADVAGSHVTVRPSTPERLGSIRLFQARDWPRDRVITKVEVRINNDPAIEVVLGPESLKSRGQIVSFAHRIVDSVDVEIVETTTAPVDPRFANPVGFAEIEVGSARVRETVRLPVSLSARSADETARHDFDIVVSRLRMDPATFNRSDEEASLDRRFELASTRSFGLSGTARVAPNAPDPVLDAVLGTTAGDATIRASSHRQGDLTARASRAFDRGEETAWTSAVGPQAGQWIEVTLGNRVDVDDITLDLVTDGHHQVPSRISVLVDGARVTSLSIDRIKDASSLGATTPVTLSIPPTSGTRVRIVIDSVRTAANSTDAYLPIAVAEIGFVGAPLVVSVATLEAECQRDLISVDDRPVGVRIVGDDDDLRTGLTVEPCDQPLRLAAGSHTMTTARGLDRGIDIDRVVLRSDATGAAAEGGVARGLSRTDAAATVTVDHDSRDSIATKVTSDGEPFWLVLSESLSEGWDPSSSDATFGPRTMVNGYANGWLVTPEFPGEFSVQLRWEPQRTVWIALAVSAIAVAACIALLVWPRRKIATGDLTTQSEIDDAPRFHVAMRAFNARASAFGLGLVTRAVTVGVLTAIVSRWWIGFALAVSSIALERVHGARIAVIAGAPTLVFVSRIVDRPELVWLSLGWLAIEVALTSRDAPLAAESSDPEA